MIYMGKKTKLTFLSVGSERKDFIVDIEESAINTRVIMTINGKSIEMDGMDVFVRDRFNKAIENEFWYCEILTSEFDTIYTHITQNC